MEMKHSPFKTLLSDFRKSKIYRYTHGQMLAVFAVTWVVFAGGMYSVYNVGTLVGERMRLQNAADAAAFTGAVWEARTLNYIAYTNRTIIAELSFVAYLTALCSCVKAWKLVCTYGQALPYVGGIFSALRSFLEIVEQALTFVIDLPWEDLMKGIGLLQSTMETLLAAKIPLAMREAAQSYDPKIKLNSGIYAQADLLNAANHYTFSGPGTEDGAIRKKGRWEGLKKVLQATICDFTQGTFNGPIPLYNRSFQFKMVVFVGVRLVIGIHGNFDIQKSKMRAEDGPFIALQYWDPTEWDWDTAFMKWWPAENHEKSLNLEDISYYDFDHEDNIGVGIYAVAQKAPEDFITKLIFQKVGGLYFGVPEKTLTALAKACARYDDPNPGSGRDSGLRGSDSDNDLGGDNEESMNNDWSPNLFNPFWKAELVAVEAKKSEDYSKGSSLTFIEEVLGSGGLLNEH